MIVIGQSERGKPRGAAKGKPNAFHLLLEADLGFSTIRAHAAKKPLYRSILNSPAQGPRSWPAVHSMFDGVIFCPPSACRLPGCRLSGC